MNAFGALRRAEGDAVVLDLTGLLDRSAEAPLNASFGEALAAGSGPIVLNFTAVDYINSTGIALVVSVLAQARTAGREVRAFGLSEHYREIFTITRLADFIGIFDDEPAAVGGSGT